MFDSFLNVFLNSIIMLLYYQYYYSVSFIYFVILSFHCNIILALIALSELLCVIIYLFFFSVWDFFHKHSRLTGLQGKGENISLTPRYHFHPLRRHLDISRAITAESSPLRAHLTISSSFLMSGHFAAYFGQCFIFY